MPATLMQQMHEAAERYLNRQVQQPFCGCHFEVQWQYLHNCWPEVGKVVGITRCAQHRGVADDVIREMTADFEDSLRVVLAKAREQGTPLEV